MEEGGDIDPRPLEPVAHCPTTMAVVQESKGLLDAETLNWYISARVCLGRGGRMAKPENGAGMHSALPCGHRGRGVQPTGHGKLGFHSSITHITQPHVPSAA